MKELNKIKWVVWVNKNSKPIVMELPFNNVGNARDFLAEQIGKNPVSIEKLD